MLPDWRGRFEFVQELLRNLLQGPANARFVEFRKRDPPIAVPGQLGIEWDGPEARDLQARWFRRP
jgi:hypothetical protein